MVVLVSGQLRAAEIHVDATLGDDLRDGTTWATSVATLQRGMSIAMATPVEDTLHVAEGTYGGSYLVLAPVVILGGYPTGGGVRDPSRRRTIIDGEWREEYGFNTFSASADFDGLTMRRYVENAIAAGDPVTLQDCILELTGFRPGPPAWHVAITGSARTVSRCIVRRNFQWTSRNARDTAAAGMSASSGYGPFLVEDSVFYENRIDPGGREPWEGPHFDVYLGNFTMRNVIADVVHATIAPVTMENVLIREKLRVSCNVPVAVSHSTIGDIEPFEQILTGQPMTLVDSIAWGTERVPTGGYNCPAFRMDVDHAIVRGGWGSGVGILDADPLLVRCPPPQGCLSHVAAGDAADSPAIDAGRGPIDATPVLGASTRRDDVVDEGIVDLGFHHWLEPIEIWRGESCRNPGLHGTTPRLPWTDAPDTVGATAPPLLFYDLPWAAETITVTRAPSTRSVRIDWR